MMQLVFLGPGRLEWQEAPEPTLRDASDALVRPITVATCDLDTALIHGDGPFQGPFPFGHEGVAEVVAIGDAVTSSACRGPTPCSSPSLTASIPWRLRA